MEPMAARWAEETGHSPCERGDWCAGRARDTETEAWTPAPAAQHLCPACQLVLDQCLRELPACYLRLGSLSTDPPRGPGTGIRRPPGSRVLVNGDAEALMRDTADIARDWAVRVRSVPQLSLAGHDHPHGSAGQVAEDCKTLRRHAAPLLALPPGPAERTWTWPPGDPMPDWLADDLGNLKQTGRGDGWVSAVTSLHGGDAGCELIDLRYAATRLLRENPAPRELLDGIPCRSCAAMGLERAPVPAGTARPADETPWSRCPSCSDLMTRAEYGEWTRWYARWAEGIDQPCARCEQDRHADCQWAQCACRASGHAGIAA